MMGSINALLIDPIAANIDFVLFPGDEARS
jgi:hypothetical protein